MPDDTLRANMQQRVFDKIPLYPVPISIVGLRAALPWLERESLRHTLRRLREDGLIEAVPNTKFSYRRVQGATTPYDKRGGARR